MLRSTNVKKSKIEISHRMKNGAKIQTNWNWKRNP